MDTSLGLSELRPIDWHARVHRLRKESMAKPKKLTKAAKKLLEEAGCSEIADDFVVLGQTDLRILLSGAAVEDLNQQAREQAEFSK